MMIVSPLLFNNTYGLPVLTTDTKCPDQVFYVWLVHLQTIWAKYGLETRFFPNDNIRKWLLDMKHGSNKSALWGVSNKKRRIWCKFVSHIFLITLRAYLCAQRTPNAQNNYFMLDWSIYTLFLLNRGWKLDSIQMKILVFVCSTRSVLELKTCFETWITRNEINGVCLFNLSYLITLIDYLCSQRTPSAQINYFMLDSSIYTLFVLNRGWKQDSLQIMIFVSVCATWIIVQHKTSFETWITRNDVNGVSLFNLFYLITHMAYLNSQRRSNVQIKYFLFRRSIYGQFVLNTGWKLDSLQMMIFVNVCSTWSIGQLKTRFETSITRNDVYGVSLFYLPYLITLMA
jgi:hypothetical protein